MICAEKCPVDGIGGGKNMIHVIDQDSRIRCGTCLQVCPQKFEAVAEITGRDVPDPIPEEKRTIVRRKAGKGAE
jgi:NADH-quinone oxidoreductase subunit F